MFDFKINNLTPTLKNHEACYKLKKNKIAFEFWMGYHIMFDIMGWHMSSLLRLYISEGSGFVFS